MLATNSNTSKNTNKILSTDVHSDGHCIFHRTNANTRYRNTVGTITAIAIMAVYLIVFIFILISKFRKVNNRERL